MHTVHEIMQLRKLRTALNLSTYVHLYRSIVQSYGIVTSSTPQNIHRRMVIPLLCIKLCYTLGINVDVYEKYLSLQCCVISVALHHYQVLSRLTVYMLYYSYTGTTTL